MKKARIFLLCNPHNPTGRVFTREELERIANLAEKYQVLILSDEIHSDLCFQGHTHIPIDTISDYAHKHSLTMIAPSKTFNIPGLATSVAIVPNPTLRKSFENKLKALGLHEGNVFGIEALEAAYTLGDSWLAELMDYLKTNRDFALKTLTTHLPKVRCFTPEGTYLLWMDFSAYGSHQEVREKLLSHNVVLSDGLIYGEEGLGWMRMNIGCPLATLNEGLARIIKGLEE